MASKLKLPFELCIIDTNKNMKYKNTKKLSIVLASLAIWGFADAQDKQTLDLLVSKNLITREEADSIGKKSVEFLAKEKATQKLTFSGRIQAQYQYLGSQENDAANTSKADVNGFQMRRLYLGVAADMGHGFSGDLVLDFAKTSSNGANYLADAYVSKKINTDFFINGKVDVGYKKVNFAFEENTSSSKLMSIERSLATRYFVESQKSAANGNLGFGSRYTGAFWNGSIKELGGLEYGFAVTNAQNYSVKPSSANAAGITADNNVNYWANVLYKTKIEDVDLKFGVNLGYGTGANSISNSKHTSIAGLNPYLELKTGGLTVWADFLLANVEDGKRVAGVYQDATPFGFNVGAEYRFDLGDFGKIAPTARYSYLNTDGRGVAIGDAMSGVPSTGASSYYDCAQSIFAGVNWYIMGDNVKMQMGYEWAQFSGSVAGNGSSANADANAFRMQMQVLF